MTDEYGKLALGKTSTLLRKIEAINAKLENVVIEENPELRYQLQLLMKDYDERMRANVIMGFVSTNNSRAMAALAMYDEWNMVKFNMLPNMMTITRDEFTEIVDALSKIDEEVSSDIRLDKIAYVKSSTLLELFANETEDYFIGQQVTIHDTYTWENNSIETTILATVTRANPMLETQFSLNIVINVFGNGTRVISHSGRGLTEGDCYTIVHYCETIPTNANVQQLGTSLTENNEMSLNVLAMPQATSEISILIGETNIIPSMSDDLYEPPVVSIESQVIKSQLSSFLPLNDDAWPNHSINDFITQVRDEDNRLSEVFRASFFENYKDVATTTNSVIHSSFGISSTCEDVKKQHEHSMMNYMIRYQHDVYQGYKDDMIQMGIEFSESNEQHVISTVFENSAAIDDLLARTVLYTEEEQEIERFASAVFFTDLPLSLVGINTNIDSPIRVGGCYEHAMSRRYEGTVAGSTPANVNLIHRRDVASGRITDADFRVFENDEIIIFVRVRAELHDHESEDASIERFLTSSGIEGQYARTVAQHSYRISNGVNSVIRSGLIPITVQAAAVTYRISEMVIVNKQGVLQPILDSVRLDVRIFNQGDSVGASRISTSGETGEFTIGSVRMPCVFIPIDLTRESQMIVNNQGGFYYVQVNDDGSFPGGQWTEDGQSWTSNNGTVFSSTLPNSRFTYYRLAQRINGVGWPANQFTLTFDISRHDVSSNIRQHGVKTPANWRNLSTMNWSSVYPNMNDDELRMRVFASLYIVVNELRLSWRVALPPESVGLRRVVDTYQVENDLVIASMLNEIERIKYTLEYHYERINANTANIEAILNPPGNNFMAMLVSSLIDLALGLVLPGVGLALTKMTKMIASSVSGPARKIFNNVMSSVSENTMSKFTSQMRKSQRPIPVTSLTRHVATVNTTAKAKRVNLIEAMNYDVNNERGSIMQNPLLPRLLPEAQMFLKTQATSPRQPGKNLLYNFSSLDDGPNGTFRTYYRPLETLKKPGEIIFNVLNKDRLRQKYQRGRVIAGNKLPAHALGTHEYIRINPATGRNEKVVTVFGVGETSPNAVRSELNANIQGLTYIEDMRGVDKGKSVGRVLSYRDSGYSDEDLRIMFNTMHGNPINTPLSLTNDQAWASVVTKTKRRVDRSTLVDEVFHTEPAVADVINDVLRNPPNVKYSLRNRNCQNFVNDFGNFLRGADNDDKWNVNFIQRLERTRNTIYFDDWDRLSSSDTFKRSVDLKPYFRRIAKVNVNVINASV
ncbi:minor capsid protein [Biston robustus cypovirus]|nr:minor capsid protein [Biston robustus cypovirus]